MLEDSTSCVAFLNVIDVSFFDARAELIPAASDYFSIQPHTEIASHKIFHLRA
jgi:hypothetical protein